MNINKVDNNVNHFQNDNLNKLAQIFPSVVKDGEVDFKALKEELGLFSEVSEEKYEFTWAGKQNAKKVAQEDVLGKTLKLVRDQCKELGKTDNIYIEGDNLEALKLIRQNYYNAVKMIYIDPPYNTGNDFIYNDNFNMSEMDSLKAEGDISDYNERYTIDRKSTRLNSSH